MRMCFDLARNASHSYRSTFVRPSCAIPLAISVTFIYSCLSAGFPALFSIKKAKQCAQRHLCFAPQR
jgi:hypothetical protein